VLSGTLFCLPSKELLGGHAPVNSNIVAIVLPDLNPVNQLSDQPVNQFLILMLSQQTGFPFLCYE
jgi:hypothetical protein